jgi:hypothetical protein
MSQAQTQAPAQYSREQLDREIKRLSREVKRIDRLLKRAIEPVSHIQRLMYGKASVSVEKPDEISKIVKKLVRTVFDAIDEMVINELQLDTNFERYSIKPQLDGKQWLGVALLRENNTVKPVVIWTDYENVGYYEVKKIE